MTISMVNGFKFAFSYLHSSWFRKNDAQLYQNCLESITLFSQEHLDMEKQIHVLSTIQVVCPRYHQFLL